VRLAIDPERTLPHSDPASRDLHLAMGAFGEAFSLALRSLGARAEPTEAPAGVWSAYRVSAGPGEQREPVSLLRRRQTSRLGYSPRPLDADALVGLRAAARGNGLELHLVPRGSTELRSFREQLFSASRESWLDSRAVE
jgi:hypothetical protein